MASAEPLKLLISLGFDPNAVNQAKESPLFVAARTNNIDAACVLIEHGVDWRIKDVHGKFVFIDEFQDFIINNKLISRLHSIRLYS